MFTANLFSTEADDGDNFSILMRWLMAAAVEVDDSSPFILISM